MKHLQIIYSRFEMLGICPSLSHQKYPFNEKTLKIYFGYWLANILFCVYLVRIAHDFAERLDVAFRISVIFLITVYYTIFVVDMEKFFQIIDMCEKIIDKSEPNNTVSSIPSISYAVTI